jgi:hypothetical protein
MSNEIDFYVPYSINDLQIRIVLFEKVKPKSNRLIFCCRINGVRIYTDSYLEKGKVIPRSDNLGMLRCFIVGYEQEEVKTDSFVLQSLALLIAEVYEERDLDSK